jgi:hypothetical protein
MAKCVFRTDLKFQPVSEPLYCVEAIDLFYRPGMPTVEECVQLLVQRDEISLGMSDQRAIMRGPNLVGYIRIVDECNWASGAAAHRAKSTK